MPELRILHNNKFSTVSAKVGESLLDVLRANNISIVAPCGGSGTCGKCTVIVNGVEVLACRTVIDGSFGDVTVPNDTKMEILDVYTNFKPAQCDRAGTKYGIAIDIGTTTLAFELLDMQCGTSIATHSVINNQRKYGADVMSRIKNCVEGNATTLTKLVQQDISDGVVHILEVSGVRDISLVTIAGNTTMLHILLNQPVNTLGVAPFTPVFIDKKVIPFAKLCPASTLDCDVIILPGISTFVGADITAGLICAGWPNVSGNNLLIDLGTNGEMALFSQNKINVTSTAAGPAFEGGNISMGMGSVSGAIAKVSYLPEDNVFSYTTINNAQPIGICGTGVVDISAELVRHSLVDETGYIESDDDEINIAPGVTFSQKDIREIQLAKSAVRAGIEILLDIANVAYADLDNVYISGGFGHKIDLKNAVTLGLIPAELESKIVPLGNSALGGAAKTLLSTICEAECEKLAKIATEINLATHPRFNDLFMEYIAF